MNMSKFRTKAYIAGLEGQDTLMYALDAVTVMPPDEAENAPEGWFAVANTEGVIAAFAVESDAYAFRLWYINSILNQ